MYRRFDDRISFSDSFSGFFGGLRSIFENLAMEETLASKRQGLDPVIYPSFGYAEDEYENIVRPFYASWSGFSTQKAFSWEDLYRLSDAPDRRSRRMMERENKRAREEAIHDYNECVRSLVSFVRKRDPRCKSKIQDDAERQKILRDAALAQAARSRAANKIKATREGDVPLWAKPVEHTENVQMDQELEKLENEVHCVVCKKTFKSEKQYESHERSKKHSKAVRQIRSMMQREDIGLSFKSESNDVISDPNDDSLTPATAEALNGGSKTTRTMDECSTSLT
jgi:DnaJ family protein A protein 5